MPETAALPTPSIDYDAVATRVLEGGVVTRSEALAITTAPEDALLSVLAAAFRLRRRYFGRDVRVHVLRNAKSGVCPEDCGFCSQSLSANGGVARYGMQSVDELVEGARIAHAKGAVMYCMVTATRGPSGRELDTVCEATRRIKAELPIRVCASLGLLRAGQAEALAGAGVDRFNHNLETSRAHFPEIVKTHAFDDRVATVRSAKAAGMEACCGGIFGLGEAAHDRVDLAFTLRELDVESIPVNFLDPRPGTPLSARPRLSAHEALCALAMMRFVNPRADLRVAGGREATLGPMQPLLLYAANSLFSEGYLTTPGADAHHDRTMIEMAGFRVAEIVPE